LGKLQPVFQKNAAKPVLDGQVKMCYYIKAKYMPLWPRCSALPVADKAEHKRVPGSIADAAACRQGRYRVPQTGE